MDMDMDWKFHIHGKPANLTPSEDSIRFQAQAQSQISKVGLILLR